MDNTKSIIEQALDELISVQFCDNTHDEATRAREEVAQIIRTLAEQLTADLERKDAIEQAAREALDVLKKITDGAIAVYEAGEKHGLSARAEMDHRDLRAARVAMKTLTKALDAKP
jgi:hypothetical protein